jgi:hypothetical protein
LRGSQVTRNEQGGGHTVQYRTVQYRSAANREASSVVQWMEWMEWMEWVECSPNGQGKPGKGSCGERFAGLQSFHWVSMGASRRTRPLESCGTHGPPDGLRRRLRQANGVPVFLYYSGAPVVLQCDSATVLQCYSYSYSATLRHCYYCTTVFLTECHSCYCKIQHNIKEAIGALLRIVQYKYVPVIDPRSS